MITEDYVSFETAKLLKEKGFDVYVRSYYEKNEYKTKEEFSTNNALWNYNISSFRYSAPTIQMAMKWLREKYNKIIVPGISLDDRTSSTISHYIAGIWYIPENNGEAFCYTSPTPYGGYPSFEEACEAGIRYCLENLI